MTTKRSIRTRKDVPQRSAPPSVPVDYAPKNKRLQSELEKIRGKISRSPVRGLDVSEVLKRYV